MHFSGSEVFKGCPVAHRFEPLFGVEFHAHRVGFKGRSADVIIAVFGGVEGVHLELHLVAVGIGVVHGDRQPVMHAPVRFDAFGLALAVILEEVVQCGDGPCQVIDADPAG